MSFLLVAACVELLLAVAGVATDASGKFVYLSSLEDVMAVFGVCAIAALVARRKGNFGVAAAASGLALCYAAAKSCAVVLWAGVPSTASITLCACAAAAACAAVAGAAVDGKKAAAAKADGYSKLESGDEESKKAQLSLRDILRLLKPYFWPRSMVGKGAVFSTLLFVILSKVCTVVAPLVLATAANAVAADGKNGVKKAIQASLVYAGLTFVGKVLKECQSLAYLNVQKYAFIDLSSDTFSHLHSLSLQWALSKKMGEVVRVTDRGIAGCDTFMRYGVLYIGPSIGEAVAVCVLFYVHFKLWELSCLVFGSVALYAFLTVKLTLWRKRFRAAMNQSDNRWHDRLTESLVNYETVKYFTAETYECEMFAKEIKSYQKSSVSVQASLSALNIAQQVILCGCLGGAMALSAIAVHRGEASVGGFVAVNVWVINLFAPLNFLGTVYNALITALVDLQNLSELLAQKPNVVDPDPPATHPGAAGEGGLAVTFKDVRFRYPGVVSEDAGLQGIGFTVAAGTSLGIVGPTGAGKSTIARLLFRFYDVDAGCVTVGGADVRGVTQESLRLLMGVVPQDTVLFNNTLDYNIRYGARGCDEKTRDSAAKHAALSDFIARLEEGWETVVGERGLKLSGGEKQRVAIARLFAKTPPIVILDEATSALDSRTEADIQAALVKLSDSRTSVTIAHRLGTIAGCDNIIVLKQGHIVERGTHKELLNIPEGEYLSMWSIQQRENGAADETKEG